MGEDQSTESGNGGTKEASRVTEGSVRRDVVLLGRLMGVQTVAAGRRRIMRGKSKACSRVSPSSCLHGEVD